MESLINRIKEVFFSKQFIMFVFIGVINTFNGVVFSYIYSSFLNENIAFIFGYISGLVISYILNSYVTFKEKLEFNNSLNLQFRIFLTLLFKIL